MAHNDERARVHAVFRRLELASAGGKTLIIQSSALIRTGRVLLAASLLGLAAAPAPSTGSFTFAVLGDRTGETVAGVYESIWGQIADEKPDFVASVGDTIQGFEDSRAAAEWAQVRPVWQRFRIPVYFAPGNHDIWSEASRHLYESATGHPSHYGFDYAGAHFTVLDNSGGLYLDEGEMTFLERDLEQSRARSPKFIVFHQPFWLLMMKLGDTNFAFHQLARRYHVDCVLTGHVHQLSRLRRDGVTYFVVGSSGGHLRGHDPRRDFDRGWFFSHLVVRVQEDRIGIEIREAKPPYGEGRVIEAADWGESGFNRSRGSRR